MLKTDTNPAITKSLTRRTFSGFIWLIVGSGIQIALKIGVLAVLARLVTPTEFGVMGIAIMILEFSKMFSHMGVGPAIIQRSDLETRHLTTGFTLSIGMGAFFALSLIAAAPYLSIFFRMPQLTKVLNLISLAFLIDSLTLIAQALMQRKMKFKILAIIEVTSYAIGYGLVGIFLAYMGYGVWALAIGNLSQAILFAILLIIAQPFPKRLGFEINAFKELILFGGGMTMAKLANFLATQGDNLVVGRMLGAAALGIYGRAYQFMVMPAGLFGNALDKALFPAMAKVQKDKERLAKAYLTGVKIIALVAIPISLIVILMAREIVLVILGQSWTDVILPLQILACSLLFRMSYKMSDSLARATGAVYRRAWRQVLYAACVLTGAFIGQFWGLQGVAYGVALALILNFLMMAHLSLQLTGVTWHEMFNAHKNGFTLTAITGVFTVVSVTLCRTGGAAEFLTLVISLLSAGLSAMIAVLYLPKLILSDDLQELLYLLVPNRFKTLLPKNA